MQSFIKRPAGTEKTQPTAQVLVRPIQLGDAERIDAMHGRLSLESLYYRYLQYRRPSLDEVHKVCALDGHTGTAFVAVLAGDEPRIVGVAYYVLETTVAPMIAELGVLVEDQFQSQGIGRSLWQQMIRQAARQRIDWLRVLTHPNNLRMIQLVRSSGLRLESTSNGGLNHYLLALDKRGWSNAIAWIRGILGIASSHKLITGIEIRRLGD